MSKSVGAQIDKPSPPTAVRGVLLVAAAAVLWGTVGVASKFLYGTADVSPVFVGFMRLALAAPPLFALSLFRVGRRTFAFAGLELGAILLVGATMALYQLFYFTAVEATGVAIATLVTICTAPLIVALLAGAILGEHLAPLVIGALLMGVIGTAMLVGVPSDAGAERDAIIAGSTWALGSAFSYAAFTMLSRILAPRHHPFSLIAIGFGVGALLLLPFAASRVPETMPIQSLCLLLYIGLVPTAMAYMLFFSGMKHAGATVASIASLMEPLTATTLAWSLFDEYLGAVGLFGAALLIGAMALLARGSVMSRSGSDQRRK
ncbi:DME family drug/metabolite transporter [Breoghania corrubedonensis]|uniref:DME family drug/metabolite transporter n=1 Tax=Breoghania corrubedonensis TaxID=665038 RepID=A0A2T5VHA5_9HYPH|nr:EamA family transporter [Breoghania corrubedonensis]PTW63141.1 DME family drug/metabolite transporter [Breoghania corrubedonensis]